MAQSKIINPNKKWKILWENQSPTSSFAAQTVSLDLQNYDVIMVHFLRDTDGSQLSASVMGFVGEAWGACGFVDVTQHIGKRQTILEADGITFQDAVTSNTYGSVTVDNTKMIPYRIYAYA